MLPVNRINLAQNEKRTQQHSICGFLWNLLLSENWLQAEVKYKNNSYKKWHENKISGWLSFSLSVVFLTKEYTKDIKKLNVYGYIINFSLTLLLAIIKVPFMNFPDKINFALSSSFYIKIQFYFVEKKYNLFNEVLSLLLMYTYIYLYINLKNLRPIFLNKNL